MICDNKKLSILKSKIYKLGSKLGLSNDSDLYPLFSNDEHVFSDGVSVYSDESGYHYIETERGKPVKKIDCNSIEDILYYIFEDITFSLALNYELEHRRANEDSLRLLFDKQLKLLNRISADYANKYQCKIDEILKKHPYKDISV